MHTYVLNTLESGLDLVDMMLRLDVPISGVIGLSDRSPGDAISGYVPLRPACEARGLPYTFIDDYSLRTQEDRQRLCALPIDVLVVAGWQRLIPTWLIDHCSTCAIGIHGSMDGISGGRGRSPQNWALIVGATSFSVSIFRIDPSIDGGDIIDTGTFALTRYDDIRTSYHKCTRVAARLLARSLADGRLQRAEFTQQPNESAYLPQRLPEDGAIDWRRCSERVHDFVRALTKPYPGAFAERDGGKIVVWRGVPFESDRSIAAPGEILDVFHSGEALVATGDGAYLIQEYELFPHSNPLKVGEKLNSEDFAKQMEKIIARHAERFPTLPIADCIKNAARPQSRGPLPQDLHNSEKKP